MDDNTLWQTKLHARLHDPAEKALVLLRDPAGHEGGTSRALHRLLEFDRIGAEGLAPEDAGTLHSVLFMNGIPSEIYETVRRADRWSAAADRPQWPMEEVAFAKAGQIKIFKVADWAQVHWAKRPVLIHPLTGIEYDLGRHGGLQATDLADIKARSLAHFASLVVKDGPATDWRRTALAFWRFGPDLREEADSGKLGALWRLLPADTRVPDHSIWDHLDLTSAFSGAFSADPDGEAALLALAIGPVQGFIAAARSTSDLWAGSHLLARLAWEAMRPVCEALGPDAILFPRLRGVPQVDLWLRDACGLDGDLFSGCEWTKGGTDSNPLFAAALPNRFVAIVPRSQARALAQRVATEVRAWLQGLGKTVVDGLLEAAGREANGEAHCYGQMRDQLAGFPEVHWAAVPFSLIRPRDPQRRTDLDTADLSAAMAPFFGCEPGQAPGFLANPAWQVCRQRLSGMIAPASSRRIPASSIRPSMTWPSGSLRRLSRRAPLTRRSRPDGAAPSPARLSGSPRTRTNWRPRSVPAPIPCGPRSPSAGPPGPRRASTSGHCRPSSGSGPVCSPQRWVPPWAGSPAASSPPPTPWPWPISSTSGYKPAAAWPPTVPWHSNAIAPIPLRCPPSCCGPTPASRPGRRQTPGGPAGAGGGPRRPR